MKLLKTLFFASAVALFCSTQANAGLMFDVTDMVLTPGSGIGTDADEANPTSLGLFTATSGVPAPFELTNAGDFNDFKAGSINFTSQEVFIRPGETDNVGYTLTLTFAGPYTGSVNIDLVGTATLGGVGDASPDYTLVQTSPVHVAFGNGGEFDIAVSKLALTKAGTSAAKDLIVTITLDHAPIVPEPSSMALLGLGGLGMAFARYRKRFKV
jgi:hypothetical protein